MNGIAVPSVVFLDRDGTIIEDRHYVARPSEVRLLPGAAEAIGRLNRENVPVVVITNQSGIGRGLFSEHEYVTVQEEMERQLAEEGARLDAVYHCPHDPTRTRCRCRKPGLALYERATRELDLADLRGAVFVGDSVTDVLPGLHLGGRTFLVQTGPSAATSIPAGVAEVRDLIEVMRRVLDGPRPPESGGAAERDK